jgi:cobalt transporter subunit CbtB
MFETLNEFTHQTIGVSLNVVAQVTLVLFISGVVIWTVLFSNYPPVHDFFHELRHALYVIPCH